MNGLSLINTGGLPSPAAVEQAFRMMVPDTSKFLYSKLFPEIQYTIPQVSYDILGAPTGRLSTSTMDSSPRPVPGRVRENVTLLPIYKDRSFVYRPTDAVNQRKLGVLNEISPAQKIMEETEAIAVAIEVEKELMCVEASFNTLSPLIAGSGAPGLYSYPVQTYSPGTVWSDPAADAIGDIIAMAKLVRGFAMNPVLRISATVAGYLAKNTAIVNLTKNSPFVNLLGTGPSGEFVVDQAIGQLLIHYTNVHHVEIYDEGYFTSDSGGAFTYNRFMPQDKAQIIGTPPENQPLASFGMTPTIHNGGFTNPLAGKFLKVFDKSALTPNGPYEIYGGFSGVPCIHFPQAICNATVHA